jgi:hypothetical protein
MTYSSDEVETSTELVTRAPSVLKKAMGRGGVPSSGGCGRGYRKRSPSRRRPQYCTEIFARNISPLGWQLVIMSLGEWRCFLVVNPTGERPNSVGLAAPYQDFRYAINLT